MAEEPVLWPQDGLIKISHVIYGLHALTVVTGLMTPAFIVTAFITGWPSLIAVVLSYVKRSEARGTFLESHFRWQIRTFWFALLWALVVGLVSLPLTLVIIGFGTWVLGMGLLGLWAIYRIARGWLRLNAHEAMPV